MRMLPALALAAAAALATPPALASGIYRHVDAQGKVYFTDQPPENAEAVELSPTNVLGTPRAADTGDSNPPPPRPAVLPYATLTVTGPQGTLQNPTEAVTINVASQPALQAGHRVVLLHNGQVVDTGGKRTYTIPWIDRGEHSFIAEIQDARGTVLIRSTPLVFQVFRSSAINRNR